MTNAPPGLGGVAAGRDIRRLTDIEEKAPFDPYHYRIIYQTFHGMRDVLGRLGDVARRRTAAAAPVLDEPERPVRRDRESGQTVGRDPRAAEFSAGCGSCR